MIRTACQHNAVRARLLHPCKRFFALGAHIFFEAHIFCPCRLNRSVYFFLRQSRTALACRIGEVLRKLYEQALFEFVFLVVGQPGVEQARFGFAQFVDIEAQRFGIGFATMGQL